MRCRIQVTDGIEMEINNNLYWSTPGDKRRKEEKREKQRDISATSVLEKAREPEESRPQQLQGVKNASGPKRWYAPSYSVKPEP